MRLIAIVSTGHDPELLADRCWQAGAAGIWEQEGEWRVGVEDTEADAFLTAVADLGPTDVTDVEPTELVGRHVTLPVAGADIELWVPPTVFGDGDHETTSSCLELLEGIVRPGDTVLDVGSGSGVLAIAAALAGGHVTAIDIDETAVGATRDNAARNDVAVSASTTPLGEIDGTFDLVIANMTAGAMGPLVDDLVRVTGPGGRLLLSGLLEDQWPSVRERIDGEVGDVRVTDVWLTALVRR